MKELKEEVLKNLLLQVQLLEQENSPAQCDMICQKIIALVAIYSAIQQDYSE